MLDLQELSEIERFTTSIQQAKRVEELPSFQDLLLGPVDSSKAVLVIHGFIGTPLEMVELGWKLVQQGFRVSIPLLPGHGESYQALFSVKKEDWIAKVEKAYTQLLSEVPERTIGVTGLSMGGTLSLYLASSHSEIRAVAPMAAPVHLSHPLQYFSFILKYLPFTLPYGAPRIKADLPEHPLLRYIDQHYRKIPIKSGLQVLSLVKQTYKQLSQITQPLLVIHSVHDDVVPVENAKLILAQVRSSVKELELVNQSYHVLVADADKDRVIERVTKFLTTHVSP